MEYAVAEALQRGQWRPSDRLRSLCHTLQAFAVQSISAAVQDGDTAGQDALNNAAVEVAEAKCQTSSTSSENTAAVGPSLPAVWC